MSDSSPLIRPVPLRSTPRRSFQLAWAPDSAESSAPGTPFREIGDPTRLSLDAIEDKASKRTSSILNLTSSTLFGIFSPSGYDSVREVPSTPWGTGAETPSQQPHGAVNRPILLPKADYFSHTKASERSLQGHFRSRSDILTLLRRAIWLFVFGVAYGLIITLLHDHQGLAPVRVENIDHKSWPYLIVWGATGVCLGGLLPWMDFLWEEAFGVSRGPQTSTAQLEPSTSRTAVDGDDERVISSSTTGLGVDWNSIVRSIGAFVGIAFAIV